MAGLSKARSLILMTELYYTFQVFERGKKTLEEIGRGKLE
jgi:hypothetical protein